MYDKMVYTDNSGHDWRMEEDWAKTAPFGIKMHCVSHDMPTLDFGELILSRGFRSSTGENYLWTRIAND